MESRIMCPRCNRFPIAEIDDERGTLYYGVPCPCGYINEHMEESAKQFKKALEYRHDRKEEVRRLKNMKQPDSTRFHTRMK